MTLLPLSSLRCSRIDVNHFDSSLPIVALDAMVLWPIAPPACCCTDLVAVEVDHGAVVADHPGAERRDLRCVGDGEGFAEVGGYVFAARA